MRPGRAHSPAALRAARGSECEKGGGNNAPTSQPVAILDLGPAWASQMAKSMPPVVRERRRRPEDSDAATRSDAMCERAGVGAGATAVLHKKVTGSVW